MARNAAVFWRVDPTPAPDPAFMQALAIIGLFGPVGPASLLVPPRRAPSGGFYGGLDTAGRAARLWVLVLGQVTTGIFARSLMNSAILGYFYGRWGTLA